MYFYLKVSKISFVLSIIFARSEMPMEKGSKQRESKDPN